MEPKYLCEQCRRDLDVGVDAFRVEEGVIGVKNFVMLDKELFCCCEKCLCEYFDLSDLPNMPPRIP